MSAVDPVTLPGMYVGEKRVVSCNFGRQISQQRLFAGVTIGSPVVTAKKQSDGSSAAAILSGSASVEGFRVKQLVVPDAGITYVLVFQADPSDNGERLIEELIFTAQAT